MSRFAAVGSPSLVPFTSGSADIPLRGKREARAGRARPERLPGQAKSPGDICLKTKALFDAARIDPAALKAAITKALSADLGDLNQIKDFPGFPRAAPATLSKAWTAGLSLADLAATAEPDAVSP